MAAATVATGMDSTGYYLFEDGWRSNLISSCQFPISTWIGKYMLNPPFARGGFFFSFPVCTVQKKYIRKQGAFKILP